MFIKSQQVLLRLPQTLSRNRGPDPARARLRGSALAVGLRGVGEGARQRLRRDGGGEGAGLPGSSCSDGNGGEFTCRAGQKQVYTCKYMEHRADSSFIITLLSTRTTVTLLLPHPVLELPDW